ncbi:2-oxoadipate dioxygenase/decarboxylase family protein [Streptomyces sioyaensis]|uniref:2-oxoadipate dioxygenase/decarboxylase family protein n=1 Tax=Streptomyces sioyaensis TaxID=67364 RepID=UPI00378F712A
MTERGIEMIDTIQGPLPNGKSPDLLLRQMSFRALAESRALRTPDGKLINGALRAIRVRWKPAASLSPATAGASTTGCSPSSMNRQPATPGGPDRTRLRPVSRARPRQRARTRGSGIGVLQVSRRARPAR